MTPSTSFIVTKGSGLWSSTTITSAFQVYEWRRQAITGPAPTPHIPRLASPVVIVVPSSPGTDSEKCSIDTGLLSRVLLKPMDFDAERLADPGGRSRELMDQGEEAVRTIGRPANRDSLGKRLFVYGGAGHVEILVHASNSIFVRYPC